MEIIQSEDNLFRLHIRKGLELSSQKKEELDRIKNEIIMNITHHNTHENEDEEANNDEKTEDQKEKKEKFLEIFLK